jgi:hypothetical protein
MDPSSKQSHDPQTTTVESETRKAKQAARDLAGGKKRQAVRRASREFASIIIHNAIREAENDMDFIDKSLRDVETAQFSLTNGKLYKQGMEFPEGSAPRNVILDAVNTNDLHWNAHKARLREHEEHVTEYIANLKKRLNKDTDSQ